MFDRRSPYEYPGDCVWKFFFSIIECFLLQVGVVFDFFFFLHGLFPVDRTGQFLEEFPLRDGFLPLLGILCVVLRDLHFKTFSPPTIWFFGISNADSPPSHIVQLYSPFPSASIRQARFFTLEALNRAGFGGVRFPSFFCFCCVF